jgi:hypothetical protein
MSFERWHNVYFEGPGAIPGTCVVALAEDEIVGCTAYGAEARTRRRPRTC